MGEPLMQLTPTNEIELDLLLARLKWPIPSVRWWAMQELATLLLESPFQSQIEKALIEELAGCVFETEAVELLSLFWMAFSRGYLVPRELGKYVRAASPLSSLFLRTMNCDRGTEGTLRSPLLLAPPNFKPTADFLSAQRVNFPHILHSVLVRLEKTSRCPMLSQNAFEWLSSVSQVPSADNDVRFFIPYPQDGMSGQFVTEASHRGRSAYLRTLCVAEKYWEMPKRLAERYSLAALPIDPTFAHLRPSRPSWLTKWGSDNIVSAETITLFIEALLAQFEQGNDKIFGAFSAPISHSPNEVLDLTVILCAEWKVAKGDSMELHSTQHASGMLMAQELETNSNYCSDDVTSKWHKDVSVTPVVARLYPDRYGYLHSNVVSRGVYMPLSRRKEMTLNVMPEDGNLTVAFGDVNLGHAGVWNEQWNTYYPSDGGPYGGIYLALNKERLPLLWDEVPLGLFYSWECKRFHRDQSHKSFSVETLRGVVQVVSSR